MTAPRRAPLDRLYVSDDELAELVGVDPKTLGEFVRLLDRNPISGFPKPDPQLGNKRYWPKAKTWFEEYNRQRRPQDRPQELKSA